VLLVLLGLFQLAQLLHQLQVRGSLEDQPRRSQWEIFLLAQWLGVSGSSDTP
jgi:hypothetical protein